MDDLKFGTRNKRGDYRPSKPLNGSPLFRWPWRPTKVLRWIPNYFLPWNLLFFAIGAALWFWATPERGIMTSFSWGWIVYIWLRNTAIVLLLFGALEYRLYLKRSQGTRFKFNHIFPADRKSEVFWFSSQNLDNMLRTFALGVPIWSAYEVVMLHLWAISWGPWALFGQSPWMLVALGLAVPLIHETHFFCIHWLLHQGPLYKWVHSVHHNSINPSPWSSLSMHPIEHLLYWSDVLIHLILPSHPLLVLYHLQVTGTGAVVGHIGFDKIEVGNEAAMDSHAYAHYLHHKYFEVNYSDGLVPFDRWFGSWHDGSKEADALMLERFRRKKQRLSGKKNRL